MMTVASTDPSVQLSLADYELSVGRAVKSGANPKLQKLAAQHPAVGAGPPRRPAAAEGPEEGRSTELQIDAALARDPRNEPALLLRARLLIDERKLDEALAAAKAAVWSAIPAVVHRAVRAGDCFTSSRHECVKRGLPSRPP